MQIETMIEAVTCERPFYLTESRSGLRISPLSPPIDSTVKLAPCGNDDNIQQNTGTALFFVKVLYLTLHVCSEVHFSAMMHKVYSRNARKDAVYRDLYGMRRGSATLLILPPGSQLHQILILLFSNKSIFRSNHEVTPII